MAQAGYTPIQLYFSTTAAAVPIAGNLANGELAINITDGKLYYKNNSGVVSLLASNATSAPVLTFSAGTTGFTPSTATSGVVTLAGTLNVANGGTGQTSYTDGQLLIGNSTGNTLTKATLTAGSNITITNGSGAITIAATGGGSAATPTALGTVYGLTSANVSPYTTALGYNAGVTNTTGQSNTFVGRNAGTSSNANYNVFVGDASGYTNSSGANNTAVGTLALFTSSTGPNNVAVGFQALYNSTIADSNTAVGVNAGYNVTTGSNNTIYGKSAMGGSSAFTGNSNVAVGEGALFAATTAVGNTAVGYLALNDNTTGSSNTAIGQWALENKTTSTQMVAIGQYAGNSGNGGSYGVYIGAEAGFNVTGVYNTAIGYRSINAAACSGSYNAALGSSSLYGMTSGSYNVGVGNEAGYTTTTGSYNVAVGGDALRINATGVYNTAIGYKTLQVQTGTGYNTALGFAALSSVTTGTNNIGIGYNGGADGGVIDITTQSDRVAIGNTSITNAYIRVAWTVTSDARDKTQITPVPHGLNFVNQLNPVSFKFRKSRTDDTPIGDVRYGFLAQDILAIEGSNSVVIDSADAENLKYIDQNMTAILVKAIQELKAEFDAYKLTHP
jgi:hypothetical protein